MGLGTKRLSKAASVADQQAIKDADAFITNGRIRNDAAKLYDKAKAALKTWLGGALCRVLPDGRTVTLTVTPTSGYSVADGSKATLTVTSPPPLENP